MTEKDPKEEKYARANKSEMQGPPAQKEGLEEPKVKGYKPIQIGIVIFVILVLIIIIFGISSDMWGLFG